MRSLSFEVDGIQYDLENIVFNEKGTAFFKVVVLKEEVELWQGQASVGPRASEIKFKEAAMAAFATRPGHQK